MIFFNYFSQSTAVRILKRKRLLKVQENPTTLREGSTTNPKENLYTVHKTGKECEPGDRRTYRLLFVFFILSDIGLKLPRYVYNRNIFFLIVV